MENSPRMETVDFLTAAARDSCDDIARMLENSPELLTASDKDGATALHYAAASGSESVLDALLAAKADVNARKSDGVTPLHVAAGTGREDAARALILAGAGLDAPDAKGRTPMSLARSRGFTRVADALVSAGATEVSFVGTPPIRVSFPPSVSDAARSSINGKSVTHSTPKVRGCPLNCIFVNLNDARVRVTAAIASSGIGGGESWGSFIKRLQPTAAVNGTFFSTTDLRPIGDIVVDGSLVHFGGMGTGLCVTRDNRVCFVSVNRSRHTDWRDYQTVICSGPRLVTDGAVAVDPRGEGFRDPHVLGSARRAAAGLTNLNRLVLINTRASCSLTTLAYIMKDLGCEQAINLDGGSSIAMHYRGKAISKPGRALTNVLMVYEN